MSKELTREQVLVAIWRMTDKDCPEIDILLDHDAAQRAAIHQLEARVKELEVVAPPCR